MNLFENTCSIVFFFALAVPIVRFSLSPIFQYGTENTKKSEKKAAF